MPSNSGLKTLSAGEFVQSCHQGQLQPLSACPASLSVYIDAVLQWLDDRRSLSIPRLMLNCLILFQSVQRALEIIRLTGLTEFAGMSTSVFS